MSDLISIMLPTYCRNKGDYLKRSLNSIIHQSYTNWELWIVDDGSTDGSKETIERYCALDSRIHTMRFEQNTGFPTITTAKCYPQTKGDYLIWVMDDTELYPNHLEELMREMKKNTSVGMVYGICVIFGVSDGKDISVPIGMPFNKAAMDRGHNHIPNPCVLVKREVIENVGWYDPHIILKRLCDWDLWRRIENKYPIAFIDKVLCREFGPKLVESSLGNQYTVFHDLILKYSNFYRDDKLSPSKIAEYDPFCKDYDFDDKDLENLNFLILEHHIKTSNIEKLSTVKSIESDLYKKILNQNINMKDFGRLNLFFNLVNYYENKLNSVKLERNRFENELFVIRSKK